MQATAYFSAEIGFSTSIPTYSGGLGVLAGDHLKAAADAGLPLVGVTLLYRQGYFRQHVGADGWQTESYPSFVPEPLLEPLAPRVELRLYGRRVHVALYRTHIVGNTGHKVPVIFLDTDLGDNAPEDRGVTARLYGGDQELRLMQEAVLGFGGSAAVSVLYPKATRYHLNEGHTAFAPLALLNSGRPLDEVRRSCHFTTHTPVPAGHDVFPYDMAERCLGNQLPENIRELAGQHALSMSELALSLAQTANGVSELHGHVAREMFPKHDIGHVTNGVHHLTWVSDPMAQLYDRELPGWRADSFVLRRATELPDEMVLAAHAQRKRELMVYANSQTGRGYADRLLTIGFARRAAAYKRASLLLRDVDRLARICGGRVQFLFAGKAHPRDEAGHRIIQAVYQASQNLGSRVRIGFIINYDMWTGALLTSGVDVWLNTPQRPHEASGTSGMKAALNAVPNASVSDGWWAEAAQDGENGWVIGKADRNEDEADAEALYRLLEEQIIPTYYDDKKRWASIMKNAVATGARFTAQRMIYEYKERYYR
jgi:glycogen phosphorylase